MRKTIATIVLGVLVWSLPAFGESFDREMIPADARWVVHVDMTKMRQTGFGKALREKVSTDEMAVKLNTFSAWIGWDPRKDLSSVTLWGENDKPHGGVLIMQGTFNEQKMMTLLHMNQYYKQSAYGDMKIHRWITQPEDQHDDGVRYVVFKDGKVIMVSRSKAILKVAIDVMRGQNKSLSGDSPLLTSGNKDVFVHMAAAEVDVLAKTRKDASWAGLVSSVSFQMGQSGQDVFMDTKMMAKDVETAERLRQSIEGIIALAQLAMENQQYEDQNWAIWTPLATNAQVASSEISVSINIRINEKEFMGMLEEAHERKHGKHKAQH